MATLKLRREDVRIFSIDLLMTIILVVNLLWFGFDFLWDNQVIRHFIEVKSPSFYNFYLPIHNNFPKYDFWFVVIFFIEFMFRWAGAVIRGVYHRWFYYPIIHFYDILGLIPAGYFRVLRVLRLVSIIYRLQRMGIIDVTQWYAYKQLMFVKEIFVEEISDLVIIRLLTSVQQGVEKQTEPDPEGHLIYKAVYPHRQEIVDWMANKVRSTASNEYTPKKDEIERQIEEMVKKIMSESAPIQTLASVPVVGKAVAQKLQNSISEGIFEGIDNVMQQLASEDNVQIEEVAGKVFDALINKKEGDMELNRIIRTIVIDILEEVKKDTAVREWKQKGTKN
jgi:hypothetical protein